MKRSKGTNRASWLGFDLAQYDRAHFRVELQPAVLRQFVRDLLPIDRPLGEQSPILGTRIEGTDPLQQIFRIEQNLVLFNAAAEGREMCDSLGRIAQDAGILRGADRAKHRKRAVEGDERSLRKRPKVGNKRYHPLLRHVQKQIIGYALRREEGADFPLGGELLSHPLALIAHYHHSAFPPTC